MRKKETKIYELNEKAAQKYKEDLNIEKNKNEQEKFAIDYDSYASNKNAQNGMPLIIKPKENDGNKGFLGLCGTQNRNSEESSCTVF